MGVGNILLTDEGFGIHVVEKLQDLYEFPNNVSLVDGGVIGLQLLGVISEADHLIVVDAVRGPKGVPGSLYRFEADAISRPIRAKNSLHEVDFLEVLTLSQALGKVLDTVILGVEPEDVETFGIGLTLTIQEKVDRMIAMILSELDRLGVSYHKRNNR